MAGKVPHLRIVPTDPDPREFPPRRYACNDAPHTCADCHCAGCPAACRCQQSHPPQPKENA